MLVLTPNIASADRAVSIADARALPLGSVVTVRGTTTIASGAFSSSTFDRGFALQDKSGGIYISLTTDVHLPLRRHVEVTGQLQEIHGLITLVPAGPDNVKMEGRGRPVVPVSVDTDGVNEATEGLLVVVEGVITQAVMNDLPYGLKFYVDDGSGEIQVFISASTGIGLGGLALGQHVRVTGFSGQYDATYEVQPRVQSDIDVLPAASELAP